MYTSVNKYKEKGGELAARGEEGDGQDRPAAYVSHREWSAPEARRAAGRSARTWAPDARRKLRLARDEAFPLRALARKLARTPDRFGLFSCFPFGGLLVMAAKLHLPENALALHLLLQRLEGLVNIVIANENLHAASLWLFD
jgi:hypothetical protein